ncbi:MAG TPA: hypothetical protein VLJ58_17850 [Ramlibacter sp.]|nr:hypothetical protein [Ramlibacter sp.]
MSLLSFLFQRSPAPSAAAGASSQAAEIAQLAASVARMEQSLQAGQARLQAGEAALRSHVDAVGDRMTERFEFVRRELFLELRMLLGADAQGQGAAPVQARILRADKVAAMREGGGLRLNVGCGHKPDAQRINVDMRELPGVDVIAAADGLPFAPGELAEIFSAHVLEHFPQDTLQRSLLPSWVGLLRPGGELRAVVPDAQAMLQAHAAGRMDFEMLRLITFGGQEYAGDFHHTMFSPESLCALFSGAGLVDVRVEAQGRPNGDCLECQVVGVRA